MIVHAHPLLQGPLRPGWQLSTVDAIKAPEKHSCVAGPFGSSISSKFFVEAGVPIIRGSNLSTGLDRFVCKEFAFISKDTAAKFTAQTVRANDLIFTCWGTIGQVGMIPADGPFDHYVISNKQLKLRVNSEIIDPLYAYYFFACPETVQYIRDRAIGSAVPGINLGILKALPVLVPPLEEQRRIASILGAYDDLIAVNRRRITLLDDMARAMFEEWFVRYRFPGHETTTIINTPNGLLPEGWIWGTLGNFAKVANSTINPGLTPDRIFAHFSLPAFDDEQKPVLEPGDAIKSNKLAFRSPTVLASKLNPRIPRVWYVPEEIAEHQVSSTEFVPLSPIGVHSAALVYAIVSSPEFRDRLTGMAGGTSTSHQRVKPSDIIKTPVAVPPDSISVTVGRYLEPHYNLSNQLRAANHHLATSRDLLLPRLISGQLSVAEAERQLLKVA